MVFAVLLVISYLIDLIHHLVNKGQKKATDSSAAAAAPASPNQAAAEEQTAAARADSEHENAVLAAAVIAAYLGTDTDHIIVRSLRRVDQTPAKSGWEQAAILKNVAQ